MGRFFLADYPSEIAGGTIMAAFRERWVRNTLYVIILLATVWQVAAFVIDVRQSADLPPMRRIAVTVQGNVDRPGIYRVPEGTSQFEILKVAGVRSTSDISGITLAQQAEDNQSIAVGTRNNAAALKANAKLEYYLGRVGITGIDGSERTVTEGLGIDEGDRVIVEDKSQAEVSLGQYSRVDLDNAAEVVFDRLNADEQGQQVTELYHKSGLCWYRIVYAQKSEQLRIVTPLIRMSANGKGAEFLVDVKFTDVTIDVSDGMVLVERPDGSESVNLIAGQRVTVYNDGRPFQVAKSAGEQNPAERFSQLARARTQVNAKNLPFNFLFCTLPSAFHFISVRYDDKSVRIIRIPPDLAVGDFAQGFTTFQEAFLYGGAAYSSTILERILNTRVQKYVVFEREDIIRAASIIGGVTMNVDQSSAKALNTSAGKQKLVGENLVGFLRPANGNQAESERRQLEVLKALFDGIRTRNIIFTAINTDQILANVESNLTTTEIMDNFRNFTSSTNWAFKTPSLPVKSITAGRKTILEPQLEGCRNLLADN
jgi:hypothetical protein